MSVCVRERERAREGEGESERDLRAGHVPTDMQINADITAKGAMFIDIERSGVACSQRLHLQSFNQSIN
jgi:hypothetical protein